MANIKKCSLMPFKDSFYAFEFSVLAANWLWVCKTLQLYFNIKEVRKS